MNVSSLKTSASGTLYTCPAGTVAEVELVAMEAGSGTLDVVSNGITTSWMSGGAALLRTSFTQASGQSSAASDNSFVEDTGGSNFVMRPRFVKLTAGDTISMAAARKCSLVIYEETTGTH
ncbi:MAG: hypothetical protein HRU77_04090 [Gammaproteobacteria bacterium]|nr:MAG: hypothetical protein HRU77_04090 [Gammaproteobacteria bacterium]